MCVVYNKIYVLLDYMQVASYLIIHYIFVLKFESIFNQHHQLPEGKFILLPSYILFFYLWVSYCNRIKIEIEVFAFFHGLKEMC